MSEKCLVTFLPNQVKVLVPTAYTIAAAAAQAGLALDSPCGGKGWCGKCRVKVLARVTSNHTEAEHNLLSQEEIQTGVRLACQTQVHNGMKVVINEEAVGDLLAVKETICPTCANFEARVKKIYLNLSPSLHQDFISDWETICTLSKIVKHPSLVSLQKLSKLMRQPKSGITVACSDGELLAVEPGDTEYKNYGCTVDLGTTTVAAYLVDLTCGTILAANADLNRQCSFGADVISRISYVKDNSDGLLALQNAAVDTINGLLKGLFTQAMVCAEHVYTITVVGNPTMIHLLLGISPLGLINVPFRPAFSDTVTLQASEVGLEVPPHVKLTVLPLVSAYLGADLVAAILAADMDRPGLPRLLLDIGTNGEMALSFNSKIWACSTAAGPALEGGGIKFGMLAKPGAISRVSILDDVELSVIGGRLPCGLCGSGLLDTVAQMLNRNLITHTGRFRDTALAENLPPAIKNRLSRDEKGFVFHLTKDIYITQNDIQQVQLAKAAMRAGVEILMKTAGIQKYDDLQEIIVAGAFGANLRPESLVTIGLLPPISTTKVRPFGNAAGTGAFLCSVSQQHFQNALRLARRIEYLELAIRRDFQDSFIREIAFRVTDFHRASDES